MLKAEKYFKIIFLLTFIVILAGCSKSEATTGTHQGYCFTDDLGNKVVISNPSRVISLFGSYTQVWQLSGGEVIAATYDAVNERALNLGDAEIIGTVKEPNIEKIISLNPDFILLSADIASHIKAADTLKKAEIAFAFFKVEQFDDYLKMLNILTDITGRKDLYKKNGTELKNKIDAIIKKADKTGTRPSVLYLRAYSTGVKSKGEDDMVGTMLKDLGAENIASKYPSMLENLNTEQIILANPDFIFITTMGQDEKAIEEVKKSVLNNKALKDINAIKNDNVYILDKEHFHYKPNNKWAESYEILYKVLYEDKQR